MAVEGPQKPQLLLCKCQFWKLEGGCDEIIVPLKTNTLKILIDTSTLQWNAALRTRNLVNNMLCAVRPSAGPESAIVYL